MVWYKCRIFFHGSPIPFFSNQHFHFKTEYRGSWKKKIHYWKISSWPDKQRMVSWVINVQNSFVFLKMTYRYFFLQTIFPECCFLVFISQFSRLKIWQLTFWTTKNSSIDRFRGSEILKCLIRQRARLVVASVLNRDTMAGCLFGPNVKYYTRYESDYNAQWLSSNIQHISCSEVQTRQKIASCFAMSSHGHILKIIMTVCKFREDKRLTHSIGTFLESNFTRTELYCLLGNVVCYIKCMTWLIDESRFLKQQ